MICPGINNCNKKSCLEQEKCLNIHHLNGRHKKINKLTAYDNLRTYLYADCHLREHFCNKPSICKILGQCLLTHPLVINNSVLYNYYQKEVSIHAVIKAFKKATYNECVTPLQECCFYCERQLLETFGPLPSMPYNELYKTRDHIIPLSKGGINGNKNTVISCFYCNNLKGNRLPEEFFNYVRLLKLRTKDPEKRSLFDMILINTGVLIKLIEPKRDKLYKKNSGT